MNHFDKYGWYTTEQLPGRSTTIAPSNTSETTTPGELRANFTGYAWVDLPYQAPPPAPVPVAEVPEEISPRQIRQALTASGLRPTVEAAVAASDQDTKDWWEFATVFERAHPRVIGMATALGVTPLQMDDLWRLGGSLT